MSMVAANPAGSNDYPDWEVAIWHEIVVWLT